MIYYIEKWKNTQVVEGTGLESLQAGKPVRGFKSPFFRHRKRNVNQNAEKIKKKSHFRIRIWTPNKEKVWKIKIS